jgi:site-specific recombinase XerD
MIKNKNFSYYLTKYFSDYLPNQIAASENTIHSYRDTFVQLLEFYKKEFNLSPEKLNYQDFSSSRIEEFLCWLEKEREISISTRNQRLAAIHAFFKYIQYRDLTGFEQCADVLSVPFKKAATAPVNYMTLEELELLFSIPDQKDIMQLRDLTIMMVMYESGARVQEIIDLQPGHFRFAGINQVELHGKGNKTRIVPINKKVAAVVKVYIDRCHLNSVNPLFANRDGEKLTRAGIQYIVNKYIEIAQNKRPDLFTKKITNHSFRHSKAMHLLESGVNLVYIRDFLGHTSVKTTEVYAKSNPKIKEEQLIKNSNSLGVLKRYDENEKEDLLYWLKNNL